MLCAKLCYYMNQITTKLASPPPLRRRHRPGGACVEGPVARTHIRRRVASKSLLPIGYGPLASCAVESPGAAVFDSGRRAGGRRVSGRLSPGPRVVISEFEGNEPDAGANRAGAAPWSRQQGRRAQSPASTCGRTAWSGRASLARQPSSPRQYRTQSRTTRRKERSRGPRATSAARQCPRSRGPRPARP